MTANTNPRRSACIVATIAVTAAGGGIAAGSGSNGTAAPDGRQSDSVTRDLSNTLTSTADTSRRSETSYDTVSGLTPADDMSAKRSPRPSDSRTQLGFFCAKSCRLPAGQLSIGPGMSQGAALVHRDGAVVGRYIDDTYVGDVRALAARFRAEHVGTILIGTYNKPGRFGPGTTNVVEHYPVLGNRSTVTPPPRVRRSSGYVLQSFSWGNNLPDGISRGRCSLADSTATCHARYAAPTVAQMRRSWCLARRTHAATLLWYYYSTANVKQILPIEQARCAR